PVLRYFTYLSTSSTEVLSEPFTPSKIIFSVRFLSFPPHKSHKRELSSSSAASFACLIRAGMETYASRQPFLPHVHCCPPIFITVCPSSLPPVSPPSKISLLSITLPPTPFPTVISTMFLCLEAAPFFISPKAWQFALLFI